MNLADTVDLILNLKLNDEASAKLKGVGRDLGKLGQNMSKVGMTLTKGLTLPILGAAGAAVKLAIDAEDTDARLAAAFRSMSASSWTSLDKLQGKAEELMSRTTFDDEAVKDAQAVMLTFGNVTNDVFDSGIESALNMSTALGTDLQSAVIQIGKALNDPVKGMLALSRAGVSFTQQQKDQIKTLVESGKTYEAQAIILGELKREFGGMAEAAAKTSGGQMAQAMNELAEAGEDIGTLLLPVIREAAGHIKNLAGAFQSLSPETKTLVIQVAALAAALGPVLFIGGKVVSTFGLMVTAGGHLLRGFGLIADALLKRVVPSMIATNTEMTAMTTKSGDLKGALLGVGVAAGAFAAGVMIANEAGNELEGQYGRNTEMLRGLTSATTEQIAEIEEAGRVALERADALKFMGFWDTEASVALRELGQEALLTADRLGKAAQESEWAGQLASHIASERAEFVDAGVSLVDGFAQGIEGTAPDLAAAMGEALNIGVVDVIHESEKNVGDAMDDLIYAMTHPMEGAAALLKIQGQLASAELRAGLASGNPFIRAQAERTKQILIEEWEKITGVAYDAGYDAHKAWTLGALAYKKIPVFKFTSAFTPGFISGENRQHGGEAEAGVPYIVGEKRPELFVPEQNGYIYPKVDMWGGGVSRTPITVNLTNTVILNTRTVARELAREQAITLARPR